MARGKARRSGRGLFVDTSIVIAKTLHGKKTKERIRARLRAYDFVASGSVARTEFRRRVLREADYLLRQIKKRKSLPAVQEHVRAVLGSHAGHRRKREICLAMVMRVFDRGLSGRKKVDQKSLIDQAKAYLRAFLLCGTETAFAGIDLQEGAKCYAGRRPVEEKKPYERYEFGPDKCCAKSGSACGVVEFLRRRLDVARTIRQHLAAQPMSEKTKEIRAAEAFLDRVMDDPDRAPQEEPCTTVGDLLIALESSDFPHFYTLNRVESKFLCPALEQKLIVRPQNPDRDDEVLDFVDATGKRQT